MEFEMIVPDARVDSEFDGQLERDDDYDRRARSIDDIENFFFDGDFNGRITIRRLVEALQQDYLNWKMDAIDQEWADNGMDFFQEFVLENDYFDEETVRDIATQQLKDEYGDKLTNQEFEQMLDAAVQEQFNEFVEEEYEARGDTYDSAYEAFQELKMEEYDETEFLRETMPYMSDVEVAYSNIVSWPYYTQAEQEDSDADINAIADEFESTIGRPVNASSSYHGATREKGKYVVEPDGSLSPDDSDDVGLEFVSPPLPIDELLNDLDKVKQWADSRGCYTNKSTGLHINVSVPDFSIDKLDYIKLALLLGDKYVLEQFDRLGNTYAKSAMDKIVDRVRQHPEDAQMLLGKMKEGLDTLATKIIHSGATDKYTSINTKKGYIEFRSPGGNWLGDKFFNQIKPTLLRFVVALDAAMDPEKYRDEYLKKLYKLLQPKSKEDTLSYFAKYAAGELPKAALKSFIKQAQLERKVAKDPTGGEQYWWRVGRPGYGASVEVVATNKADAIALGKKEYPEWEYARDMTATPIRPYSDKPISGRTSEPQQTYLINNGSYNTSSIRASGPEDAIQQFRLRMRNEANPSTYSLISTDDQVLARGDDSTASQNTDSRNQVRQTDMDNRLGLGSQAADANYEIVDRQTNRPVFLFIANTDTEAWHKYSDWLAAAGYPEDTENYGWRPRGARGQHAQSGTAAIPGSTIDLQRQRAAQAQQIPEVPLDIEIAQPTTQSASQRPSGEFTGQWLIRDPQGRTIHRFGGVGNVQSDANRVAIAWLRTHPGTMQAGVTVVPEMQ